MLPRTDLPLLTSAAVKTQAAAAGFDLCGISPVAAFPELDFFRTWIDAGYAGEMDYLRRTAEKRRDVRSVVPSARSVIMLATVYNTDEPYSTESSDRKIAALARYAWGDDYHDVIQQRLNELVAWLKERTGDGVEARAYVDTGPVQERVYGQYAGLGWIGKNTCLINEELGSWIFLSAIITNLDLEADAPGFDQCGTCERCLDACPTGALVAPHVLDSTRCLSYLTIELKGPIPESQREDLGRHAYGCDICQEVCPWNVTPSTGVSTAQSWLPRAGLDSPTLLDLWQRSDDDLRRLLKGSAMKRAGVKRLRRNLAVAIGNSADTAAAAALERLDEPTCHDPLVAGHVAWAVRQLRPAERSSQEPLKVRIDD
jgi:epoxyqueuosine reductase